MSGSDPQGGVLCAGFGTRMQPLTETVPKPLVPFLNTPILTYALDHLASTGVERVGMNLHHLPEAIPPVANRICGKFGLDARYAREWEILGTAGGIRGIWRALGEPDAPLIVTNGDSVMNIDLEEHLEEHRASGAAVTLVVRPRESDQPGKVWLEGNSGNLGRLRDFSDPNSGAEAELEEHDFTGVQILEPAVLSDIPLERGDIIDEVYGPMLERGGAIEASVHNDFWAALDNPSLLMEVTRDVLDRPERFEQAPVDEGVEGGVYAADPGVLSGDLEVEPPVFLGEDVELGEGVTVGPYAVLDGVAVGPDLTVEECILYGIGELQASRRDCVGVSDRVASI